LGSLTELHAFDQAAILDMKWSHAGKHTDPLLAIASAEGRIDLRSWHTTTSTLVLQHSLFIASRDVLCLSIDWSGRKSEGIAYA